ncbi:bacteriocin immunity protein [Streptococcus sp. SL1232]|nr:bacteriocin immunity protein [Streptococcus vicugnae]MBJ7540953.1 bacteriocin immunity protein [Streptococcus vicugnae]
MPSLKSRNEMLKQIYNLILDSDISDGERKLFIEAKEQLENNRDFL